MVEEVQGSILAEKSMQEARYWEDYNAGRQYEAKFHSGVIVGLEKALRLLGGVEPRGALEAERDRVRRLSTMLESGLALWRRVAQLVIEKHYPDAQEVTQFEFLQQARIDLGHELAVEPAEGSEDEQVPSDTD